MRSRSTKIVISQDLQVHYFDFNKFYSKLAARGMVIYPGKLTNGDCFRIGSIGRLFESDMQNLVDASREVLVGMGVKLPVRQMSHREESEMAKMKL